MLPLSVRRAVSAASQASAGLGSALAPALPPCAPLLARGHQRRCSSSKPSRPDNDAGDIAAGRSVAASPASSRADGKAGGDKRKRKNKEASLRKLPSVPDTHHMSKEALGLSTFFSLHRPISITQTMPRAVTSEHFASIFAPRTKNNKMADAMTTLSNTIDMLDGPMAQMTIGGQQQQDGEFKVDVRNPDGSQSSIYLQVDAMAGDFSPYRPPPLPQPPAAADAAASAAAETAPVEDAPQHRVYKAVFTIEESAEPDGQVRIVAHSPRIVNGDAPRSFLERMARRQLRYEEAQARREMHALSVRRQRKLKMKKKKYKKLMKRMRNQRRKLDRA